MKSSSRAGMMIDSGVAQYIRNLQGDTQNTIKYAIQNAICIILCTVIQNAVHNKTENTIEYSI